MTDILITSYLWIKSLHVISVIAWMAGIFYLPRLFVHHVEQVAPDSETDALFQMMETKLLKVIMTPAMVASWIFGLMLVSIPGLIDWSAGWPWIKALSVIGMSVFHMWCARQRKNIAAGVNQRSGRYFRAMNEVPTLLLILIVVSVIARPF
ncbi:protoporphyrinogen oxidase HemJ [Oceaniglobus indicus]|uniref:protoporphyrinogen oxidase HemJ n=1 Tax=Oceaniglobus indicus TaxID=2047749 RepID=UPI000C18AA4D|nr:protoporphyrinogen oxidase HemJ [Oceaniglobus indicus]